MLNVGDKLRYIVGERQKTWLERELSDKMSYLLVKLFTEVMGQVDRETGDGCCYKQRDKDIY